MVAAIEHAPSLEQWWTEEKCRSHNPWPTHEAARKAASLHPINVVTCWKCNAGQRCEAFRCPSDPSHFHFGHGQFWTGDQTMPTLSPSPVRVAVAKLTTEQACEVFRLYHDDHVNPRVIAAEFGVVPQTVHEIAKGRTYLWATRALFEARGMPTLPKSIKRTKQEAPVQITTPPTMLNQDADSKPLSGLKVVVPSSALTTDLADAAEWLLEQRETIAAPKFVLSAIRTLIAQARALP